ncbi:MAG: group II intron maturase-specific domain-containing protein, partial [Acidimicrobiales bacterium]
GIDQTTIAEVEEYGVDRLLDELETELREGRFKPLPARRVYIPSLVATSGDRSRSRFLTMRARLVAPVEQVVAEINLFLRGWAGFFRFGNSAWVFEETRKYAVMRIALFVAKTHKRGRSWGFTQV